ncbi:MAG: hypothetical protein HN842_06780 [Gammaproteobacteria bacterium]|jgi:LmbE family N-acetylglucosaminyl deacetylase|nr:hypothetical protein [Gammaproteobacteria bacterium]
MKALEQDLIPYSSSPLPEGPWLVFAPHADDETFGMGGAILLATAAGMDIYVDVVTDGRAGGDGSDALVHSRQQEAMDACSILGAKPPHFWGVSDRSVEATAEWIAIASQRIDEIKPKSLFFPSAFELHPDHRAVAFLVWEGAEQCGYSGRILSYEISVQGVINLLLDTTLVVDQKQDVMRVYCSQLGENNYLDVIRSLDRMRTYTLPEKTTAAEGFYEYSLSGRGSFEAQVVRSVRSYLEL